VNLKELKSILAEVSYKDWKFEAKAFSEHFPTMPEYFYIRVEFRAEDTCTKRASVLWGRKWCISPHACASEVVLTALKAVLAAEEHEARERFHYRGRAIVNPHVDVEALWEIAHKLEVRP
jgi:hypothetical protein